MDLETFCDRLAKLAVEVGANVQNDQIVAVTYSPGHGTASPRRSRAGLRSGASSSIRSSSTVTSSASGSRPRAKRHSIRAASGGASASWPRRREGRSHLDRSEPGSGVLEGVDPERARQGRPAVRQGGCHADQGSLDELDDRALPHAGRVEQGPPRSLRRGRLHEAARPAGATSCASTKTTSLPGTRVATS